MAILSTYLRGLLRVHMSLVGSLVLSLEKSLPSNAACAVRNLKSRLKGLPHRFSYEAETGLYRVEDASGVHVFARRVRGFGLYRDGVQARADELARSYLIDQVPLRPGDIVIDCGANYADLSVYLRNKIDPADYIAFEPGTVEYAVVSRSAPEGQLHQKGLGNANTTLRFYLDSEHADSSVIEPTSFTDDIEVETVRLDDFVQQSGVERIRLLKLEAEGFEPEILEGASETLPRVDYVAIDGGYERGVDAEETFSRQTNTLTAAGFQMMGINLTLGRALFRNAAATD